MSNPQKSMCRAIKKMFRRVFSPASRIPSPAPPRESNVHETGSDGTQVLDASASNATAFTDSSPAFESGNSASSQPPVVVGPTMVHDTQVGVRDHVEAGSGGIRVDVPQMNLTPSDNGQGHLAKSAWHGMQMLLKMAEKLLEGTPLKTPIAAFNVLIDLGNAISDNKDALHELYTQTQKRLEVVNAGLLEIDNKDTKFRVITEEFAQSLIKKILELKAMSETSTWKKILENEKDNGKVQKIFKQIDKETETFILQMNFNIDRNISSLHYLVSRLELHNLHHSHRAPYNAILNDATVARAPCIEGTRVRILKQLYEWAEDSSPTSPQVFWLTGPAGSGKSTIACSVAEHFDDNNKGLNILQASFFCSRQFEDTRSRANIIPTLVYQLAHHSKSFLQSLFDVNKLDPVHKLSKQMNDLLVEPWQLSTSKEFRTLPPYLVVIDALDEIHNSGGSEFLKELLITIEKGALHGLKFLVTSRPDPNIVELCKSFSSDAVCHLYDVDADEVGADILIYLKDQLPALENEIELVTLMQQANGLFIYASTAEWKEQFTSVPAIKGSRGQTGLISEIRQKAEVMSVAFSPDGIHIVSGSWDNTIYVWDSSTGAELLHLTGHTSDVNSVAYSPDGIHIVSGSMDNTIYVWDSSTGAELLHLIGHTECVNSVAFSPDGTHIASGSWDKTICVWDSSTGAEILQLSGHTGGVNSVAFSPDGTHIVSGSMDNTICVWDSSTGAELLQLTGHTGGVNSVAFSPDGTHIVSGSMDNTICVWDSSTGTKQLQLTGHTEHINSVAFSPDGMHIVSGSMDNTIFVWDSSTGAELLQLTGHEDGVISVAFSPDGTHIASGSWDKTICVWDSSTGAELLQLTGHSECVNSVAFSPDGIHIVSGSWDNTICVWNSSTGAELLQLTGHKERINSVAFSPDGTHIVSGSWDHTICVWDSSTGAELLQLTGHEDGVISVAFSPDGTHIASGSWDKTICVWDSSTGAKVLQLTGHTECVNSVAFSPDGTHIVSGSMDHTIYVWNSSTGAKQLQLAGHTGGVNSVAFSPDGTHIVSGSWDKTIFVWDSSTGAELLQFIGHTGGVNSVAFSPDGTHIVSGSWDKTICVWDSSTGAELLQLTGHSECVNSVAFSPDGIHIVSGSWDNTICVWDSSTGAELLQLTGHTGTVNSVALSPDAPHTGSGETMVHICNVPLNAEHLPTVLIDPHNVSPLAKQDIPTEILTTRLLNSHWYSTTDGWLNLKNTKQHLMWVPSDILRVLRHPHNHLIISKHGDLSLDFSQAKLGTEWVQCYTGPPSHNHEST
ncbi:hypothetical protein E4T56_gene3575 [Termitomyces sp. T112]|nr:hypothetical protein E4T56_gene3575 [Termitomyces sp. T112]